MFRFWLPSNQLKFNTHVFTCEMIAPTPTTSEKEKWLRYGPVFHKFFLSFAWHRPSCGLADAKSALGSKSFATPVLMQHRQTPIQMRKTLNDVPLSLTCPSRFNLTQTNKLTVKSVEGIVHSFDSLLRVDATAFFKLFPKAHVHNLTATLWLCPDFSKQLNDTSQVWRLIKSYTLAINGLCITALLASPCSS